MKAWVNCNVARFQAPPRFYMNMGVALLYWESANSNKQKKPQLGLRSRGKPATGWVARTFLQHKTKGSWGLQTPDYLMKEVSSHGLLHLPPSCDQHLRANFESGCIELTRQRVVSGISFGTASCKTRRCSKDNEDPAVCLWSFVSCSVAGHSCRCCLLLIRVVKYARLSQWSRAA